MAALVDGGITETRELFFALALDDVRAAADYLRPVYDRTDGRDGFVSFECTPDIAHDTSATVEQAWDLWNRLDRPNVMIKVPATSAGIPAIEELTARGVNINITLLFALRRYDEVIDAYLSGLERRATRDLPLDRIASVASFFVSRVDTKADDDLAPGSPLRGTVAVTNARRAFRLHHKRFTEARWRRLAAQGAPDQRPLWASTGTRIPFSDVLYVEQLIAPGVVNTMPLATLDAFDDHGNAQFPPIDVEDSADDLAGVELRAAVWIWNRSPPRWSAKASKRSRTPTSSSSTASGRRRGSCRQGVGKIGAWSRAAIEACTSTGLHWGDRGGCG